MEKLTSLKIGDKVCYQPKHYAKTVWENGVVKEIPEFITDSVRVVYNCANDWKNYRNYTSALTRLQDLQLEWK